MNSWSPAAARFRPTERETGAHEILRMFELYVFPKLGKLSVQEVTRRHWLELL